MTQNIRLSIIMVDGSFRERLDTIDYLESQTLPAHEYELIWCEYYGTLRPELSQKLDSYPNCRPIILNRTGTYHSSLCFNAGIKASRSEILMILDADLIVEKNFLERVLAFHENTDRIVMYCYRYDEPECQHQTTVDLDHLRRVCHLVNAANYGGCLTLRKKWLLCINGYEQHPVFETGFHANGRDVYTRLNALGLPVCWHPELKLYHPWHPATRASAPQYLLQREVIEYRALHLESEAFEGIDPARNRPLPSELEQRLRVRKIPLVRSRHRSVMRSIGGRTKRAVKRIFNSVLKIT